MTTIAKPLMAAAYASNAQTTVYTAPTGTRVIIDKVTGYNDDVSGVTLAVNLVPAAGSAGASNLIVFKTIAGGETYVFPELVGHILGAGEFISVIAGAASAIVLRISGREVTF